MEKLRGPINPCLIAEDLEVGWLEEFINNTGNLKFEDNPYKYNLEEYNYGDNNNNNNNNADYFYNNNFPNLEDKIPFLQMLQSVEIPQQQEEQNFQLLLRLQQHQKLMGYTDFEINHGVNDGLIMDLPVIKSENDGINQVIMEETKKCKNKRNNLGKNNNNNNNNVSVNGGVIKEKRKRKRTVKPAKNKQEVENQRMTHIAVERNRRRQMNEHLNALRSLMPPSYVQRGDQASIIGGAIDFVKELEQMLQSLEAKKKIRQYEENGDVSMTSTSTSPSSNMHLNNNGFMASPSSSSSSQFQLRNQFHSQEERKGNGNGGEGMGMGMGMGMRKSNNTNEEFSAERKSALADIEVVVIQNHVNLKIKCERRHGQLLKAIVAFEDLRLNVLHLNITSLHNLVHYSFNLKIEEDCKLGSADEVARAVHQIFSLINLSPQLN